MLVGNGMRLSSNPMRMMGGAQNYAVNRFGYAQNGAINNIFTGGISTKSGLPSGYRHPASWRMGMKSGGLSSRNNTEADFSQVANLVGGKNAIGEATLTFTADATGGLIVSGSGSSSISLTATGAVLAVVNASGSVEITFTPSAAIGAQAGVSGQATITLTPTLGSYAVGYMSGTSSSDAEFSADNLAAAVWGAVASSYNASGTMGEKMNDAGSASNPWTEVIESGYTAEEILRLIASVLAGKVSGAGTGTETFKGLDGTTNRVVSTVDTSGNRIGVTLNGS